MKRLKHILFIVVISVLSCTSRSPNNPADQEKTPEIRINKPPVILGLTADQDSVGISGEIRFTCLAEDPDGDSLNYAWIAVKTKEDGSVDVTYHSYFGFDSTEFIPTGNEAIWIAPRWAGTYKVICTATDKAGYEEMAEAPMTVTLSDRVYGITEKYHYLIDEPIHFTVGNNYYSQIEVMNCAFSVLSILEKFDEDSWNTIMSPGCLAIGTPIPLQFQESVSDSIPYYLSESGFYRLQFQIRVDQSNVVEDLISNAFVVE